MARRCAALNCYVISSMTASDKDCTDRLHEACTIMNSWLQAYQVNFRAMRKILLFQNSSMNVEIPYDLRPEFFQGCLPVKCPYGDPKIEDSAPDAIKAPDNVTGAITTSITKSNMENTDTVESPLIPEKKQEPSWWQRFTQRIL
jgi:hypothetical protein